MKMRTFQTTALVAVTAFGLGACQTALGIQGDDLAKAQIKELVDEYAMARDDADGPAYGSVFTPNGILVVNGEAFQGRDTIAGRLIGIDPLGTTVHIMSTSEIDIESPTTASGRHYAIVYTGTRDAAAPTDPVVISNFMYIGKYTDKYELTNEGWKIAERAFTPVFKTE